MCDAVLGGTGRYNKVKGNQQVSCWSLAYLYFASKAAFAAAGKDVSYSFPGVTRNTSQGFGGGSLLAGRSQIVHKPCALQCLMLEKGLLILFMWHIYIYMVYLLI